MIQHTNPDYHHCPSIYHDQSFQFTANQSVFFLSLISMHKMENVILFYKSIHPSVC